MIDVDVSSVDAEVPVGWRSDAVQAMGRSQNLVVANDGTTANVLAIQDQGALPWKFTWSGALTADDRFGFIGERVCDTGANVCYTIDVQLYFTSEQNEEWIKCSS